MQEGKSCFKEKEKEGEEEDKVSKAKVGISGFNLLIFNARV